MDEEESTPEPKPTSKPALLSRKTSLAILRSPKDSRPLKRSKSHTQRPNPRAVPGRQRPGTSPSAVQSSYEASPFGNDEPFGDRSLVRVDAGQGAGLSAAPTTYKKGREWSGQWNRDDIEEVAKKLRGLKLK